MDSLGSKKECRIGYKHSHSRVSQCLGSIRKLGNRSSEGLRSFKPSKRTLFFILIILAGDIEMNPGPRFQCGLCTKKHYKGWDRLLGCGECEKRFHASCSKLGDNELLRIASGDGAWYYTNCKADCGLCSGDVIKGHKAVQCDSCDMWIHD